MKTLRTRIGGWPLLVIVEDGASVAHLTDEAGPLPHHGRMRTVTAPWDVKAFAVHVSAVQQWIDEMLPWGRQHSTEHWRQAAHDGDLLSVLRCGECRYWDRVRHDHSDDSLHQRQPLPKVSPPHERMDHALWYRDDRVVWMGPEFWSTPVDGVRHRTVALHTVTGWGETRYAEARLDEVTIRPYRRLT